MNPIVELEKRCASLPPWRLYAWGLALVALIGLFDYFTGTEISVSVAFLIPVALVAWCGKKPAGYLFSIVAALTWLFVEIISNHAYSQGWIAFWNALVRFLFFLVTAHLLTTLRTYLDREYTLLRIDRLTGAKNAQAFREEIRFLLRLAARHRHPTALACLDLDHFKAVNDALGHEEGDRILQTIVMSLTLFGRATDVVGRLGGDEFAILLPETDLAGARHAMDKLHDRVGKTIADQGWPIGISMGVAIFPEQPPNVAEALKFADALLQRVRRERPGGVIYEVHAGGRAVARGDGPAPSA